jgi:murein DD-endopeptidase MepM/ murein hydrolase activator NlpD
MVYFNPHLANRDEFQNYDFAKANVAGLSLMTKGILAGGTPPAIIQNVINQMMGFGTQFQLPPSYFPGSVQDRLRKKRALDVQGRLSIEDAKAFGVTAGGNYLQYKEDIQKQVTATVDKFGKLSSIEEQRKAVAEQLGIKLRATKEQIATPDQLIQQATDETLRKNMSSVKELRGLAGTAFSDAQRNISTLESTVAEQSYLIDILDMYTFVEKRAIDGYLFGQPVWQKQGPLISILRTFSNEPINELFFDLRPLSTETGNDDNDFRPVEGGYSITADDKNGNLNEGEENGITMIPAVIMREYPFATIDGVDLSAVTLQVKSQKDPVTGEAKEINVGPVPFGAIFADGPNTPGRHVVDIPNINVDDRALARADSQAVSAEPTALGYKHLDVAVVSEGEIIKSTLGRSDADHFNLFEFWSDAVLGTDQKFYMKDVLPIITPVHILRHGLRVRTVTTRAARFSLEAVAKQKGFRGAVPEKIPATNKRDNSAEDLGEVDPRQIGLPIGPDPSVVSFINNAQGDWGYRRKPGARCPDVPGGEIGGWVFHQGIDITKKRSVTYSVDIPVYAIADGWVTHCVPDGVKAGYGNHIVVRHNFTGIKGFRSSLYGHLAAFAPGVRLGKSSRLTGTASKIGNYCAATEASGVGTPLQKVKQIKKGQLLGYMGNTGTSKEGTGRGIHLHFEIIRRYVTRKDEVTRRIPFSESPTTGSTPAAPASFDDSGENTDTMVAAGQRGCDPVEFYSAFGKDLVGLLNGGVGADPSDQGETEDDDQDNGDGSAEETANNPISDVQEETGTPLIPKREAAAAKNSVDSGSTRRQILRWALLQDHWYQHNLEYLSGRIDMRGAPEIRVGYRLDIKERNMSFYIEGVNHSWSYPNSMKTNLQVSRGQPNNPFPLYVYPYMENLGTTDSQRRNARSRLATYFLTPDPVAIRRSLFLRGDTVKEAGLYRNNAYAATASQENGTNIVDNISAIEYVEEAKVSEKYNEMVVPAGRVVDLTDSGLQDNEDARDNTDTSIISGTDSSGLPKLGSFRKRKRRR